MKTRKFIQDAFAGMAKQSVPFAEAPGAARRTGAEADAAADGEGAAAPAIRRTLNDDARSSRRSDALYTLKDGGLTG